MAESLRTAFPSLAAKWDELTPKLAELESRFAIDDENRVSILLLMLKRRCCSSGLAMVRRMDDAHERCVVWRRWCGVRAAMRVRADDERAGKGGARADGPVVGAARS